MKKSLQKNSSTLVFEIFLQFCYFYVFISGFMCYLGRNQLNLVFYLLLNTLRCATLFLFYVMLSGTKYDGISLTAVSTLGIAAQRHAKCEVVVFSVVWCCLI